MWRALHLFSSPTGRALTGHRLSPFLASSGALGPASHTLSIPEGHQYSGGPQKQWGWRRAEGVGFEPTRA